MGRGGSVELTTGDLGMIGATILKRVTFDFTREYNFGEVIELMDLPANARLVKVFMYDLNVGATFSSYNFAIGTTETPDAITGLNGATGGLNFDSLYKWHKETVASKLILTSQDDFSGNTSTTGLTGKTAEIFVEYIQE